MPHDTKKYLRDIELAIGKIRTFLPKNYDFDAYNQDTKTQYAIERALAIIGEAMYQLLKTTPDIAITNAPEIAKTRHILVHAYDKVDNLVVWDILHNHLDLLEEQVAGLLEA
ncbi:MAG: DUF86 domain-containing protein [Saprospiraceae bacterium]|nr:DUF86 domain-containing protein [Saprospiraceae bacterium]